MDQRSLIQRAHDILDHADEVGNGSNEVIDQFIVCGLIELDELHRDQIPERVYHSIWQVGADLELAEFVLSVAPNGSLIAMDAEGNTYALDREALTIGINQYITTAVDMRHDPEVTADFILAAYDIRAQRWDDLRLDEAITQSIIEFTIEELRDGAR
ncbi:MULTISPECIES: hypothetical protein [Corynebacterium]|uniref:hypothetical protein n=1 Tax=Corynebacterium TaxID=1716 RepID=UPI0018834CB8|nr:MULTISPECIES: hypothetical protein [Corynebacterium]MBF0582447.1 hypothetical protein [Corynebacterium sp. ED61]MDC7105065.1 hypothetical protein [Corynebacterium falsenii]